MKDFPLLKQSHGMSCWWTASNMIRKKYKRPWVSDKIQGVETAVEGTIINDVTHAQLDKQQIEFASLIGISEKTLIERAVKTGLGPSVVERIPFFTAVGLTPLKPTYLDHSWLIRRPMIVDSLLSKFHNKYNELIENIFTTHHWQALVNNYGPLWCTVYNGKHAVVIVGTSGTNGITFGDGEEVIYNMKTETRPGFEYVSHVTTKKTKKGIEKEIRGKRILRGPTIQLTPFQAQLYDKVFPQGSDGRGYRESIENKRILEKIEKQYQIENLLKTQSNNGQVIIADPATGQFKSIETKEFNKIWFNVNLENPEDTGLAWSKYAVRNQCIPTQDRRSNALKEDIRFFCTIANYKVTQTTENNVPVIPKIERILSTLNLD